MWLFSGKLVKKQHILQLSEKTEVKIKSISKSKYFERFSSVLCVNPHQIVPAHPLKYYAYIQIYLASFGI